MSDPVTWMYIAVAAVKVVQGVSEGMSGRAQYDAAVDMASRNADMAGQQGNEQEELQRRHNRAFMGAQRAAIAESGVGFGGSSIGVQQKSAIDAELDALNIRYEGTLKRNQFLYEKESAKTARSANTRSMYLKIAGDLLSTGASAYGAGAFGSGLQPISVSAKRIPLGNTAAVGPYSTSLPTRGMSPPRY